LHRTAQDVSPGGVSERPEDAIGVLLPEAGTTYNHLVVRLAPDRTSLRELGQLNGRGRYKE